jgi:hypothetical protein
VVLPGFNQNVQNDEFHNGSGHAAKNAAGSRGTSIFELTTLASHCCSDFSINKIHVRERLSLGSYRK